MKDSGVAVDRRDPSWPTGAHPDSERLAEYADGRLSGDARTEIEAHLAACDNCRTVFTDAMTFAAELEPVTVTPGAGRVLGFTSRKRVLGAVAAGLAAAASLLIVARVVGVWPFVVETPYDDLIAAIGEVRPVDGRLA